MIKSVRRAYCKQTQKNTQKMQDIPFCLFLYPERTLSEAKGYLNVAFFFRVRPSVRPSVRNQNCERTDSGRTDPGRT